MEIFPVKRLHAEEFVNLCEIRRFMSEKKTRQTSAATAEAPPFSKYVLHWGQICVFITLRLHFTSYAFLRVVSMNLCHLLCFLAIRLSTIVVQNQENQGESPS